MAFSSSHETKPKQIVLCIKWEDYEWSRSTSVLYVIILHLAAFDFERPAVVAGEIRTNGESRKVDLGC